MDATQNYRTKVHIRFKNWIVKLQMTMQKYYDQLVAIWAN